MRRFYSKYKTSIWKHRISFEEALLTQAEKVLLDSHFWARHDKPFAKRRAGYMRRLQRRFKRNLTNEVSQALHIP